MNHKSRLLCLLTALLLLPSSVFALKSDREKKIHIQADRVEIKEKEEISHYTGNVSLTQGTLKIDAQDIKVYLKNGDIEKIIIKGKPAKIEQQPDENEQIVHSEANLIEYYAGEDYLLLKENARWRQGESSLSGNALEYHIQTSTIKGAGEENTRVEAIIQPKKKKETETDSQNPSSF